MIIVDGKPCAFDVDGSRNLEQTLDKVMREDRMRERCVTNVCISKNAIEIRTSFQQCEEKCGRL